MKRALMAPCLLLLSGCFLKQTPPAGMTTSSSYARSAGVIRVEEIHGEATMATFEAGVQEVKDDGTRAPRSVRELQPVGFVLASGRSREPVCKVYRIPKTSAETDERASAFLSMGKMWFGIDDQASLLSVAEDGDHKYYRKLDTGLPPTIYRVQGDGSPLVPSFKTTLAFPESLSSVTIGEQAIEDVLAVKKSDGLKLGWNAPALAHSGHIVQLELYTEIAEEVRLLRCLAAESDLGVGKRVWTVPAQYTELLHPTPEGLLFLSRILVKDVGSAVLSLENQGMQTYFAKVAVE